MTEVFGQGPGEDPWPPGGDPPPAWAGDPSSSSPLIALLAQMRDRPLNRLTRRLRRLRARSDQLARRDPSAVPNVFAPGVGAVASTAPGRRRRRRPRLRMGGGRFLVSLVLVSGMLLPFYSPLTRFGEGAPTAFPDDSPQATLYQALDELSAGDLVLVGMEYGPTAAGELDTVASVLLRHVLLRRAIPVVVSRYPVTLLRAEQMLTQLGAAGSSLARQLERDDGLAANDDWFVTRFLAGDMAGLRSLTMNLKKQLARNLRGAATGLAINDPGEFERVLVVAERPEDLRQWAEQIGPLANGELLAATGQAAVPLTRPWLRVALSGSLAGFRDALTYDSLLSQVEVTTGPPSAPGNLRAVSRDAGIELAWDPPLSDGGSPLTGYTIRHLSAPRQSQVDVPLTGTGTTYTLTGLENGRAYDVEVRAVNAEGAGPWSQQITVVPFTTPAQPQSLALTAGDAGAAVGWSAPADDGGSSLRGYRLRWRTGTDAWRRATLAADETRFTVTGLTNDDTWEFQVLAFNLAGDGDWSAAATVVPRAGLPAPGPVGTTGERLDEAPAATATPAIVRATVRQGAIELTLRAAADAASNAVGAVSPGDLLLVLLRDPAGTWLFVQTNGGLRGWLPAISLDLGATDVTNLPQQDRPAPTPAPLSTPIPPPTSEALQVGASRTQQGPAPALRGGMISQATARETSIHVGLALSIALIALGALGNMGGAVLRRGRRR